MGMPHGMQRFVVSLCSAENQSLDQVRFVTIPVEFDCAVDRGQC